ncbi:MAG: hypothetical protein IJH94_05825 [Clostridia bacterium]|nr:hypothetical protein [Clostridia bacterium]
MDNDRENVINDLIKYYDSDNPAGADDMGATRVMPDTKKSEPAEEELGNTVVVNVKKKPIPKPAVEPKPAEVEAPALPEDDDDDGIKVYTPTARKLPPIQTASLPEEETPVDEVLGNLDFIGMPIIEPIVPAAEEVPDQKPVIQEEEPNETDYQSTEEAMKKRTGIWYALKPLWVTIIFCLIAAAGVKFYLTNDGIIGTYKRNFNYNMGLIYNMFGREWNPPTYTLPTIGAAVPKARLLAENAPTEINIDSSDYTEKDIVREETESLYYSAKEARLIPFAKAGSSKIAATDGGVVCARSNHLCFIDSGGDIEWETETPISDPILSVNGKYIAVAAKGGTQLSLYKRKKLVFYTEISDNIRSLNVSRRGDVVLVTAKPSYKGAVIMINRKGEKVFSWSSGVNYITAVNVLKNRRVAVSVVSADERIASYVILFDINSTEPIFGVELQDSLVYALDTDGKHIFVNGDNCVCCLTRHGGMKYDLRYDDSLITHSANDTRGNRLIAFTDSNAAGLNLYNKHGDLESGLVTEGEPDFIDIYKTTVLYNNGRDIISGDADDEKKALYTASRTIEDLKLINKSTAAVLYADGIEIIKF